MLNNLMPAFTENYNQSTLQYILLNGETLISAFSFLLILQFIFNRNPKPVYFSILLVPIVSSIPLICGAIDNDLFCIGLDVCISSDKALYLNNIIISSFIFMLLVFITIRRAKDVTGNEQFKKYKYWLVISLLIYNILQLILQLAFVADVVIQSRYILTNTLINMAFVYMVLTSIFRVFTDVFDIKPLRNIPLHSELTLYEKSISDKIEDMLETKHVHTEQGLNRAEFAKKLNISEHQLSKIINTSFGKSFTDLFNEYRIHDAKKMLANSTKTITEISFDSGFNSIASFNRVFKKEVGKSPSEYKADMDDI